MSVEKIIISIIASIIQCFSCTIIISKQLNEITKKRKLIFFILLSIYAIIGYLFVPNQLRFILFGTVISLILYFPLKIKSKNVILYAFNTILIFSISENLSSIVLVLFGLNSNDIVNDFKYNLIANILISLLAILIINFKITIHIIKQEFKLLNKNKYLINYLYLVLLLLYLVTLKNGLEFLLKSNYYINTAFIIGVILILMIIMKSESKAEQLKELNKQMLNYVTKYEKIITDQGKANHEFKNQLMVIRGYAQINNRDKLIEYLDTISEDLSKAHSSYLIRQLNKIPDGGIKGLLYYKLASMEDYNISYQINVENNVKPKLKNLNTNMYNNITKILGILLDNAIDASKKCKNKEVIIDVVRERAQVIFNISNTYSGKIDISKIGDGYTTKGKGHGYGLKVIKDIINENEKLNIENSINKNYYVSKLSVKIIEKKKK